MRSLSLNEQLRDLATVLAPQQVPPYSDVAHRSRRRRVLRCLGASFSLIALAGLGVWGHDSARTNRSTEPGDTVAGTKTLLTQSTWTLVSVRTGDTTWQAPAGAGTLKFTDTSWIYSDGVNEGEGSATFLAGAIRLSPADSSGASEPTDPGLRKLQQVTHDDLTGDLGVAGTSTSITLSGHGAMLHYLGKSATNATPSPAPTPSG